MTKKSEIGKLGEDIACEYLLNKSFTIIERNFRQPWGEIDIITKNPGGALVFVEVKTMQQYGNNAAIAALLPEDNLTKSKLKKLQRISYLYANHNSELLDDRQGWQIDLITIVLNEAGTDIKHFENI
ncbi:MAG: YraN family protein [Candidatus Harrisonbacteria bacterium]|nr:YraN family protein [Candidatus Harrisonbacteria bacterium]